MHLRYDLHGAHVLGVIGHPQKVMKQLGITYLHSTPQSLGDQWWFWCCENVPEQLPECITELDIEDPFTCVGFGLSFDDAIKISNYGRNN